MTRRMRDQMSADDLRNVEEGTHLIIDLHPDEYWETGEGTVEWVRENDDGSTTIGMTPISGPQHTMRLKIPADARGRTLFTGVAKGAKNLRVSRVYER